MLVYLSLGSNLGNREQTIEEAIRLIGQDAGTLLRRSSFYYSAPWGFRSEHEFCNICLAIDTTLSPLDLLHTTQRIERTLGRLHKSVDGNYQDRSIDIDILTYEGVSVSSPELTLPHPLMHERDFVMIPLREIQTDAI